MDTTAYLKRQGWRGDGHSLDLTGRGIRKPLLLNKKVDVLGVGVKKHAAVSDQWWMRAFDEGLKNLGTGVQSVLGNVQKHGIYTGGLYGRFVKGQSLAGTIENIVPQAKSTGYHHDPAIATIDPSIHIAAQIDRSDDSTDSDDTASVQVTRSILPASHSSEPFIAKVIEMGGIKRKREEKKSVLSKRARKTPTDRETLNESAAPDAGMPTKPREEGNKQNLRKKVKEQRKAERLARKPAMLKKDKATVKKRDQRLGTEGDWSGTADTVVDDFTNGADEIKLDVATNGQSNNEISQVASIEQPPTKPENSLNRLIATVGDATDEQNTVRTALENEKIDVYRAKQHNIDLAEYRARLARGEIRAPSVDIKKLSAGKLATYQIRAAEKGLTVEDYVRRRDEKYAAKQGERLIQDSLSSKEASRAPNGMSPEIDSADPAGGNLAFVTDTAGDESLTQKSRKKRKLNTKPKDVVDADGNIQYTVRQDEPVPLDPSVWAGVVVKTLPKAVREARRQWMANRRAERRGRPLPNPGPSAIATKQNRARRKIEVRERFVSKILDASREAHAAGRVDPVQIDDVPNVPLVRITTIDGKFSKEEIKLGRAVARRVLRGEKKMKRKPGERESGGKGKSYQKRGRVKKGL